MHDGVRDALVSDVDSTVELEAERVEHELGDARHSGLNGLKSEALELEFEGRTCFDKCLGELVLYWPWLSGAQRVFRDDSACGRAWRGPRERARNAFECAEIVALHYVAHANGIDCK